jgi:hypothetical protein
MRLWAGALGIPSIFLFEFYLLAFKFKNR